MIVIGQPSDNRQLDLSQGFSSLVNNLTSLWMFELTFVFNFDIVYHIFGFVQLNEIIKIHQHAGFT